MRTILDEIVETKRTEVAAAKAQRPIEAVQAVAEQADPARDFLKAVVGSGLRVAVIAEIKQASPSAGLIVRDFDPAGIARIYADHGATDEAARTALVTENASARFYHAKTQTARFFVRQILPENDWLAAAIESGDRSALDVHF